MARHVEFDEAAALTAAMQAFRRDGYQRSSIKTLEQVTGLSSGSLYNSFGGKDAIFRRAFAHYNETVVKKRIDTYVAGRPVKEGLTALFLSLLNEPGGGRFGCLLTNSAIEFAGGTCPAQDDLQQGLALLRGAFEESLASLPGFSVEKAASEALRLLVFYQGLLVMIRAGAGNNDLQQTIENEIDSIIGVINA